MNQRNAYASKASAKVKPSTGLSVQPKLAVNAPGDRYEQEADAMADRVMRKPSQPLGMSPASLMRKPGGGDGGFAASPGMTSRLGNTKGGGSPLPTGTRNFMENAFSADFSRVRIHTDEPAAEMSREIQAKAFTQGNDIYFDQNQYQIDSEQGQWLLAHELTHVLQQGQGGRAITIQRKGSDPDTGSLPTSTQPATPDVQPATKKNTLRIGYLSFRYQTEEELPAASRDETNAPQVIWYIQKAFNLDKATATQIVALVQWRPEASRRARRAKEWIEFRLSIQGIQATLGHLRDFGKVDSKAVEKFEKILAHAEAMTHRDYEYFVRSRGNKFSNLNIEGFTVANLSKVEAAFVEFEADKESVLRPLGLLDDYYRADDTIRDLEFEALKDRLFDKSESDLTEADKESILSLFRQKAMRKVFRMLEKSNTISRQELTRYQTRPQELDQLIAILKGNFHPLYEEANQLRVRALSKFFADYQINAYSVPGGEKTRDLRKLLKAYGEGDAALLESVSTIASASIEWQVANFFAHNLFLKYNAPYHNQVNSYAEAFEASRIMVANEYPDLARASEKDQATSEHLKNNYAEQYPILYDLSLDFRLLSHLPKADLKGRILTELKDKEKKSAETQTRLLKEPWLIWEFQPLLYSLMTEEGIAKEDAIGKVIHGKIESVKDHKFWRSLALAALGIALGIAGFFTGGATWVGLALIGASIVVNVIDLHYELKDYSLHSAAAHATFEGNLTNEPSSIGVIFAIAGLGLDLFSALKLVKSIGKALNTAEDVAAYASEAFDKLSKAGKIPEGVTREIFVKSLVENWQRRTALMSQLPKDLQAIVKGKAFQSLHQGVQEGLFRIFDVDKEAFAYLLKTFKKNPDILTRLGAQSMLDGKASRAVSDLFHLSKEAPGLALDDILRYYGSVGSHALSSAPDVLSVLLRSHILDQYPELAKEILTNRTLQEALLRNASDPSMLLRHWEQYQAKLATLPSKGAKSGFLQYLEEQSAVAARLAEESAGIPKLVDLAVEQIQVTAKLSETDMKIVREIIQQLVKEKAFLTGHQMQAIIRMAEQNAALLAAGISKNLRGFLWQLRNASTAIGKTGMNPDNLKALLRGLENADEFETALRLVDTLNNPSHGVRVVDNILSSMTMVQLDALRISEGAVFSMSDLASVVSRVQGTGQGAEIWTLAEAAGKYTGKTTDLSRLRSILESLDEGKHSADAVETAIRNADLFDERLAKALADPNNGLEETARLIWGDEGVSVAKGKITVPGKFRRAGEQGVAGSGSRAYKQAMSNADTLIGRVVAGGEIDPVKWAMVRKAITDATIDQGIKNNIIGELWARANIRRFSNEYDLIRREAGIQFHTSDGLKVPTAKADAVMKAKKGDEILILEFKSGDAEFRKAQELIYGMIKKGEWDKLAAVNPELARLLKAHPDKIRFLEIREPFTGT